MNRPLDEWRCRGELKLIAFGQTEGNAAVFSSVELVDWMLGFSRGRIN